MSYFIIGDYIYRLAADPIATLSDYLQTTDDNAGFELVRYKPNKFVKWLEHNYGGSYDDILKYLYNVDDLEFEEAEDAIYYIADLGDEDPNKLVDEFLYRHMDSDLLDEYGQPEEAFENFFGDSSAPSFVYLDYVDDYSDWLIHFSKEENILSIAQGGFTKGFSDHKRLGLTTWAKPMNALNRMMSGIPKMKNPPPKGVGYNFGYRLGDYSEYMKHADGQWRYGNAAVVFRASAVIAEHRSDGDVQAIFWGPDAHSIIAIVPADEDSYYVLGCDGDPVSDKLSLGEAVKLATSRPAEIACA